MTHEKRARRAIGRWASAPHTPNLGELLRSVLEHEFAALEREARADERERCAEHLDNFLTLYDIDYLRECAKGELLKEHTKRCAAAIRALTDREETA